MDPMSHVRQMAKQGATKGMMVAELKRNDVEHKTAINTVNLFLLRRSSIRQVFAGLFISSLGVFDLIFPDMLPEGRRQFPWFEFLVFSGTVTVAIAILRIATGWELAWLGDSDKSTPT